jgi:hypothetical protein
MKATPSRRQLIVFILLGLALLGGGMRLWAPNPSLAHDIGTLLLVLWLPVIGNVVAFLIRYFGWRLKRQTTFAPGTPFTAHLRIRMAPVDPPADAVRGLAPDDRACALVIGTEGFTARLAVPLARGLSSATDDAVEVQFLRPALALPRFPVATDFRLVAQGRVVGVGRVLGTPGWPPAAPAPARL